MSIVASYRFSPNTCGTTADSSAGNLLGDMVAPTLDCSSADGVTTVSSSSTPIVSANNIGALRAQLTSDEFSMEFWITQASAANQVLMSIEDSSPELNMDTFCDFSMRLYRNADSGKITFKVCTDKVATISENTSAFDNSGLVHLVVTIKHTGGNTFYDMFANGVHVLDQAPLSDSHFTSGGGTVIGCQDAWLPTNKIKLLGSAGWSFNNNAWDGSMYAFNIHDAALDGTTIAARYNAGLPALPVPSEAPTHVPTALPTATPTAQPTPEPSHVPSAIPTALPSEVPTHIPTAVPTQEPTEIPTQVPSPAPSASPSAAPSPSPSQAPSEEPTPMPSYAPTEAPSFAPSDAPTPAPSAQPSESPTPAPSHQPSFSPSEAPTPSPTLDPTAMPSASPSPVPTEIPTESPTENPTFFPSQAPTAAPSQVPTENPTPAPSPLPSAMPSASPSASPSESPTELPTPIPTPVPTAVPSALPTQSPSHEPSPAPSEMPSFQPSEAPTAAPSAQPSASPTQAPSHAPTEMPSFSPSEVPTESPTHAPSALPTAMPSAAPSASPTHIPTVNPTAAPSAQPSVTPTQAPSHAPTAMPSFSPSEVPTESPTHAPSASPTAMPSAQPSAQPSAEPSASPTHIPTVSPTAVPSAQPSASPTKVPTVSPTASPSAAPSLEPTLEPSVQPTLLPTAQPSFAPSPSPSHVPTVEPSHQPTQQPSFAPTAVQGHVGVGVRQEMSTTMSAAEFQAHPSAITAFEDAVAVGIDVEADEVYITAVSDLVIEDSASGSASVSASASFDDDNDQSDELADPWAILQEQIEQEYLEEYPNDVQDSEQQEELASGSDRRILSSNEGIAIEYTVNVPVTGTLSGGIDEALNRVNTAVSAPTFAADLTTAMQAVPNMPVIEAAPNSTTQQALWIPVEGASVLASYEFNREGCISGSFADLVVSPLLGSIDGTALICNGGTGIRVNNTAAVVEPPLVATEVIDSLREALGQDFSIELWLQAQAGQTSDKLILSVEEEDIPSNGLACDHSLSISHGYNGEQVLLYLCRPGCQQYLVASANMLQPTHVVVTEQQGTYKVYVDGVQQAQDTPICQDRGIGASDWLDSSRLRLLGGVEAPSSGWPGTIYSLTFHANTLTDIEVEERYRSSFPNSRPQAHTSLLVVRENGEDGDHSLQPEFYDSPIATTDLISLLLQVSDEDDTDPSPLYNATLGALTKLELTSLPQGGSLLYYVNGSAITQVPVYVPRSSDGTFAVRFRPPLDEHSINNEPFCSFRFRAIDGIDSTLVSSEAVVSVVVTDTNKPPVPLSIPSHHAVITNVPTVLPPFAGTDVDGTVTGAGIAVLPAGGLLYDVALNGTVFPSPFTLPSDGSAYRLQGFRVAYQHTGSQAVIVMDERGVFGDDSFSFVVIDNGGLASRRETCTVDLVTALRANAFTSSNVSPAAVQDEHSLLTLGGIDVSGLGRDLFIRVLRFPSNGTLYAADIGVNASYKPGAELSLAAAEASIPIVSSYNLGAPMFYRGNVFSVPLYTADIPSARIPSALPDSFEYEVFSSDGSRSVSVTQQVEVRNVNKPTELSFTLDTQAWPLGHIRVHAVGLVPADGVPSSAEITGFSLPDPDLSADLIRVRLQSQQGGKMSLGKSALPHLIFIGSRCRGTRWQCIGSGDTESTMDFLATPYWAESALNGLTYRSTREEIWDNITLSVYDGAGGNCLDNNQGSASLRFGQCHIRSVHWPVEVLSFAQPPQEPAPDFDTSAFSILEDRTGILVSVAVLCILCCIIGRACGYFKERVRKKFCPVPPASPDSIEKGEGKSKSKSKSKSKGDNKDKDKDKDQDKRQQRKQSAKSGREKGETYANTSTSTGGATIESAVTLSDTESESSCSSDSGSNSRSDRGKSDSDDDSDCDSGDFHLAGERSKNRSSQNRSKSKSKSHRMNKSLQNESKYKDSDDSSSTAAALSYVPEGTRASSIRPPPPPSHPPLRHAAGGAGAGTIASVDTGMHASMSIHGSRKPPPPPPRRSHSVGAGTGSGAGVTINAALAYNSAQAMREHSGENQAQLTTVMRGKDEGNCTERNNAEVNTDIHINLESLYAAAEEDFSYSYTSTLIKQQQMQRGVSSGPLWSPTGIGPSYGDRLCLHMPPTPPGPAPSPNLTVTFTASAEENTTHDRVEVASLEYARGGASSYANTGTDTGTTDAGHVVFNMSTLVQPVGVVGLSVNSFPPHLAGHNNHNIINMARFKTSSVGSSPDVEEIAPNPLSSTALHRAHRAATQWRHGSLPGHEQGQGQGQGQVPAWITRDASQNQYQSQNLPWRSSARTHAHGQNSPLLFAQDRVRGTSTGTFKEEESSDISPRVEPTEGWV